MEYYKILTLDNLPNEEWLTDEAYKEYEDLQLALRSAQSAYDDEHIIC